MKVAVGLSGGVDSSVTACLLKEQGYDVIGVTMLIWEDSTCCSGEALKDARKVAQYLNIPHYVYDLIPEFTKEIVDNFVSSYQNGKTPNPCPTCNSKMKFEFLWNAVKEKHPDIEKIATGHYARVKFDENTNRNQILKGLDPKKDQSYMLFKLNKEQVSRIILPLGEYKKTETRELAKKFNLNHVANKPDSMDLCFTSGNLKEFLKSRIKEKVLAGDIIDTKGRKLGTHEGIINYTVGQRKGINVGSHEKLYVLSIDPLTNTIIVGNKDETYSPGLIAENLNWVSIDEPKTPIYAEVKTRYLSNPEPAEIIPIGNKTAKVVFKEKQSSIAPGQEAVFYSNDILLGGGTICKVIN
jgi:tRNA-specific 2-thiouridylase